MCENLWDKGVITPDKLASVKKDLHNLTLIKIAMKNGKKLSNMPGVDDLILFYIDVLHQLGRD